MTAEQVQILTTELLASHLPLGVTGYRYHDQDIFNVLVAAAAQQRSLESVCQQLVTAPSANLVRHYLTERLFARLDLDRLEAACNRVLVERLPAAVRARPVRLAIDLTLRPYYGTDGEVSEQVRRGAAKAGTTRFHAYATAFVLDAGRRVTLALTFVYAHEALADVVTDLLDRVQRLGVTVAYLFLDREFATVAVLDALHDQPFVSVVALPKKGQRLQAHLTGRASFRTTYTMRSADDGAITFPLWVACRYAAGRRGQHRREYWPFAVVGRPACPWPVRRLADTYRSRFGIESRYRQAEQVRAPTTSRQPGLRLLLVAISLLLPNLTVWLKAQILRATPPPARAAVRTWLAARLRLDHFRDLLITALQARYVVHTTLALPLAYPLLLKL